MDGLTESAHFTAASGPLQERRASYDAAGASGSDDRPGLSGKKLSSSSLRETQAGAQTSGRQAGQRPAGSASESDHSRQGSEDTVVDAEGRSLAVAQVDKPSSRKRQQVLTF